MSSDATSPGVDDWTERLSVRAEIGVVAGLTALGLLLRVWRIDAIPPGLWFDEAVNGLAALDLLERDFFQIFFQYEQFPREPLYVYCVAPLVKLLGPQPWAIRLASAFVGAATLPLAYLFAREWFGRRTALAALACLVFLRWHVHFSRTGFRTILAPPFMLLGFYFLHRGLRLERARQFALAGVAFAAGFYTYLSFRLVPFVFLIWAVGCFRLERDDFQRLKKGVLPLAVAGLLVLAPLLAHYVKERYHFSGRTKQISLFEEGAREGVKAVAANARDVALMFSFRGDAMARHNVPERHRKWGDAVDKPPLTVFDPLTSLAFYLGLVLALGRCRRSAAWLLAVGWFFIMALNSVLSFGAPNLLRTLSMAPIVALLLGEGLLWLGDALRRARLPRGLAWGIVCALFLWFGTQQTWSYFRTFPEAKKTWDGFNARHCDLARFALERAPECDVYLPGDYWSHASVMYLVHGAPGVYELTLPAALSRPAGAAARDRLIVYTSWTGIETDLPALFPKGRVERTFLDAAGREWACAYLVPAAGLRTSAQIERYFRGRIGQDVHPER